MKSLRFARVLPGVALVLGALAAGGAGSPRLDRAPPALGGGGLGGGSPNPGPGGTLPWAVSARAERDVWAVGVQATYTSNDPLAVHWDGTSWTAVPTPTPVPDCEDGNIQWGGNSLDAVDGASADDV